MARICNEHEACEVKTCLGFYGFACCQSASVGAQAELHRSEERGLGRTEDVALCHRDVD